jgi:hypothetical protein
MNPKAAASNLDEIALNCDQHHVRAPCGLGGPSALALIKFLSLLKYNLNRVLCFQHPSSQVSDDAWRAPNLNLRLLRSNTMLCFQQISVRAADKWQSDAFS